MKRIYYLLSDNADLGDMHFDNLDAVMDHIKSEQEWYTENDLEEIEFTIGFKLMTEDEYEAVCNNT